MSMELNKPDTGQGPPYSPTPCVHTIVILQDQHYTLYTQGLPQEGVTVENEIYFFYKQFSAKCLENIEYKVQTKHTLSFTYMY